MPRKRTGRDGIYQREDSQYWWCSFTVGGHRLRLSTGCRDREAARDAYDALRKRHKADPFIDPEDPRQTRPLKQITAEYLDYIHATKSSGYAKTIEGQIGNHWLARWQYLDEINQATVERYRIERSAAFMLPHMQPVEGDHRLPIQRPITQSTVHRELVALRRFLRWCVDRDYLRDQDVPRIDLPRQPKRPVAVYLTPEQVEVLLAALPDRTAHPNGLPCRETYTLLWETGLRIGTWEQVRWDDIDLGAGILRIRPEIDKTEEGRVVPLTERAIAVLISLPHRDGLVLGKHDYRKGLARACLASELPRIRPNHDFRHARASHLVGTSGDIAAAQYLLGHRQLSTTQRYVHTNIERARAALQRADRKPGGGDGGA